MTSDLAIPEIVTSEVVGLYPSDPASMVALATEQAKQLSAIIEDRQLFAMIKKRKHVTVEGWTTLGAMLGVFPVVVWSRELTDAEGTNLGWEARVEARTIAGQIVGAAEAECRRAESTWKTRESYALRSMAQTRATSKALRLPLGFIVVMAGLEATPTEEHNLGVVNQAKTEVLALLDGDKVEAAGLWEAALEDHEIKSDAEIDPDQIESILSYIREAIELTNPKEGGDDDASEEESA